MTLTTYFFKDLILSYDLLSINMKCVNSVIMCYRNGASQASRTIFIRAACLCGKVISLSL